MTSCGYHVKTADGKPAYVIRAGVLQMADGSRMLMPQGCRYIKPVHFDRAVDDWHLVEHWTTVRLGSLPADAPAVVWRESVGASPVLTAAERLGWGVARPMLAAFGITNLKKQGQLVEWALQLRDAQMDSVRRVARQYGIGPVLSALELTCHDTMYAQLADENGVERTAGLAWR